MVGLLRLVLRVLLSGDGVTGGLARKQANECDQGCGPDVMGSGAVCTAPVRLIVV